MKFIKTFIMPLLLIVLCGLLLESAYVEVKNRAIDQLNNQQLVMAETGAKGIESFFVHYGQLLTQLSKMKQIASLDEQGRQLMQVVYLTHASEIKGITRVSASGHVIYTFPESPGAIGADLTSQEHIQAIMQTHQPVVSDVFGSIQGFETIAFHIPVFEDGIFQGSLCVLIPFDQLSRNYLEPIKIGKDGYAWIVSRKGVELYCPVPGHIGKSVFENCKDFPTILSMAQEMLKGNRGTTTYFFDRVRGETVESLKKRAVYVPVNLGNTFWSIVVATPEDEVVDIIQGFKDRWLLIIGVLMLIAIVWTSYALRTFKILKEEAKRKRTETALKESEEKYRELVENANSIIVRMDEVGNVTFFNEFAQRFFGYSEEEILGKNVIGTVVPEIESTGRNLEQMIKDIAVNPDGYANNINENMCRNGEKVWVAWTNKPIRYENGRVVEILCVGNDITDRKRADDALRESEEKFRAVLDGTPFPIAVVDLQDNNIHFWSRSAQTLFGHTAPTASEWYQIAYPDPKYRLEVIERWKPFLETARQFHRAVNTGEYRVTCSDGSVRICELYAAFLADILVVTFNDITERRRAEEERANLEERLRRAEKMEALGTLAGGVAHDLNNVLGIVVGYSELLLDHLDESNSARSEAWEILKGGQRAAAIVQDLLTLARRGVPNRKVLNLNNIVLECRKSPEFARLLSYQPNIQIKTDIESDVLNVLGSSVHLEKSFMNLVSNATEAMPGGGTLTVKTANCYLDKPISGYDEVKEGEYVVLSISDTGEGIPASDLKRIFEPFYTKKVMGRSGTGLGLAVVWGTVKDHLGYINVESAEGKGTTFTLYFPVTREEISPELVSVSAAEYMGNGESILVVDDVKQQRELAERMLTKLHYTVVSVSSGEEAVEYLRDRTVDVVVLDMIMDPGMDGLDTYRKLLEIKPYQKAVIVSGFSENEQVTQAQALGAGAYVKKPYVLEKLGLAVKRELNRAE